MSLLTLYPSKSQPIEPEVSKTASMMTTLLQLQHYSPQKALLALTLAAEQIVTDRDNLELLKQKAILRGASAARELMNAEGGSLSAEAFGEQVGVSRETVNQWRQAGKILGWKRGARNYSYPAWQIHQGEVLSGLEALLKILGDKTSNSLEIADYLLSESDELGARPLDLLRQKKVEAVLEHANRYGDIGA